MSHQHTPQKHTTQTESSELTITLFVYGTLKRGFSNHDRFCRNATDIRPATTWGRLYQLPAGYPALEIPESSILAHGAADPLADAATQARLAAQLPQHALHRPPSGDWDLIHGELITFPDPDRDLPPIDQLEGYHPESYSLYNRVLIPVWDGKITVLSWLYSAGALIQNRNQTRIWGF